MSEDCPHCVYEKNEANCRGCFEGSNYRPKPATNADHIRDMTDEELAAKIEELCQYAFMQISVYSKPMGKAEWLDWLKEEAANDNHDH